MLGDGGEREACDTRSRRKIRIKRKQMFAVGKTKAKEGRRGIQVV